MTHLIPPTSTSTSAAEIFSETVKVLVSTTLTVPPILLTAGTFENWKVNGYGVLLGMTSSLVMSCGGGFAMIS